jgi:uncharacterized membrane protein
VGSLPDHIAETVDAVEELHSKYNEEASKLELWAERGSRMLGSPLLLAASAIAIVGWVVASWLLNIDGLNGLSPNTWLQTALGIFAVFATILILSGQRRQERLARHREQLILHLALLNERKTGKLIALFEEFRKEHPEMQNRYDPEAEAMAAKVDPKMVSDAIAEVQNE